MTATQSRELTPVQQVYQNIELMQDKFKKALPPHVNSEKFARVAITAIQNTPDLQAIAAQSPSARNSILNACSKAAADGLMPDGREGAIVAFNRNVAAKGQTPKWEKHAQWMPMVEGYRKMVRQSGEVSTINVQVVKDGDDFDYQLGDKPFIFHKPALKNRGKTIGAYSIVQLKDGELSREYMDIEDIYRIRERSKSKDSGPWKTDEDEMCKKTVFRRHYKSLPKSTDLDKVIENDDDFEGSVPADLVRNAPLATAAGFDPETGEVDFGGEADQEVQSPAKRAPASRAKAAAMKHAEPAKKANVIEEEVDFNAAEEQEDDVA